MSNDRYLDERRIAEEHMRDVDGSRGLFELQKAQAASPLPPTPTKLRVLVWQWNGTIRVFSAVTPLDFMRIYTRLKVELNGWDLGEQLAKLEHKMGIATTQKTCEVLFKDFANKHIGTHETFEAFGFTDLE